MKLELTKIEAITLEEAYTKASIQLECSITDLEFEIVQNPSKGFLGFGKKSAIIVAAKKIVITTPEKHENKDVREKKAKHDDRTHHVGNSASVQKDTQVYDKIADEKLAIDKSTTEHSVKKQHSSKDSKTSIIDESFYQDRPSILEICSEIDREINDLFKLSCFELDKITVTPEDDDTVMIKISGNDSALMIGKEGYRYNAMSYLLFNWINPKYKVGVKLEIAEFLQNQEEVVKKYIESVVQQVRNSGQARTKPLDGVLLQIAIKELRHIFPEKYVGVKTSDSGAKFVVINDFAKKN